jgi:RNA polymerase sigma factor (sigma-70 family)
MAQISSSVLSSNDQDRGGLSAPDSCERNIMPATDAKLLDQYIKTNDAVAFDQLARRYRGMVFATARRVTGNYHDAEDVSQGCFLELARRAETVKSSVAAYLHSTATRRSIDLLRDHARRKKYERRAVEDRPAAGTGDDPAERPWEEVSPEVDLAIEQLPEEYREAIILYYLRGLTETDIAHELKMNRARVMRRLQVGVRRLRASLSKDGKFISAGTLALGLKAGGAISIPASLTAATGRMALVARLGKPCMSPRRYALQSGTSTAAALIGSFAFSYWGIAAVIVVAVGLFLARGPAEAKPPGPYDRLSQLYGAYLPNDAVDGFAWHTASIKSDLSSFWRGSQPLFFQWSKGNCRNWLDDPSAYAVCNASPNLEDAERLADEVNADNSAKMPVQVELLQGLITIRLAANGGFQSANDRTAYKVASTLCNTYRAALLSDGPVDGTSLAQQPDDERDDVRNYVDPKTGDFGPVVVLHDKVFEFLIGSRITPAEAAGLLKSAAERNGELRAITGAEPRVRSIRRQVRYSSVVTQGRAEFLVMLDGSTYAKPRILELKQQTPSPAELAGAVERDSRLPAQRAAENAAALDISPDEPTVGWCVKGDESYTVSPFAPQGFVCELRKDRWVDPVVAARVWAVATAATHRNDPHRRELAAKITPDLAGELVSRCDAYTQSMRLDLEAFCNDPRVAHDRLAEEATITRWMDEARRSLLPQ